MVAKGRRDWLGSSFGFIAFFAGIALLLLTFQLAYDMFRISPQKALGVTPSKTLEITAVGMSFASVVIRILLLLVMGLVGSLVANRGILLIGHCRPHASRTPEHDG
jgi:hypothetical protein